ncbi:MAG: hypothetical protein R6X32_06195 [Chloroflexota bacterium]|jgi:uncharacterized spore protein YtfJ
MMSNDVNKIFIEKIPDQEKANELMAKLFTVTQPEAVFSPPVTAHEQTVITASEVTAGFGFGFGSGGGIAPNQNEGDDAATGFGGGGGGGGGGTAQARPVAAVIITAHGVRVEPIVDVTKISIAFFTAFGAIISMLYKMRSRE